MLSGVDLFTVMLPIPLLTSILLGFSPTTPPHALLGVPVGASLGHIKQAFREKAKLYHPDASQAEKEAFQELRDAYDFLKSGSSGASQDALSDEVVVIETDPISPYSEPIFSAPQTASAFGCMKATPMTVSPMKAVPQATPTPMLGRAAPTPVTVRIKKVAKSGRAVAGAVSSRTAKGLSTVADRKWICLVVMLLLRSMVEVQVTWLGPMAAVRPMMWALSAVPLEFLE